MHSLPGKIHNCLLVTVIMLALLIWVLDLKQNHNIIMATNENKHVVVSVTNAEHNNNDTSGIESKTTMENKIDSPKMQKKSLRGVHKTRFVLLFTPYTHSEIDLKFLAMVINPEMLIDADACRSTPLH